MKADFYTEVYNIVKEIPEGCGYLRAVSQTRPEATMFPHGRASHVQRPERAELALPQGSKQPREIGSQLDGTKGTAGKRRHRFQKERVRGFKEAYLGGDIAHYLRYVTPSQSSLSPKSISTPLSI